MTGYENSTEIFARGEYPLPLHQSRPGHCKLLRNLNDRFGVQDRGRE
jgi:hypothetical protein